MAAYVRANPPAPIEEHTMSNLETHEAEQIAITALCDIALCGHPECEARGAMEASREFAAQAGEDPTPCERAQQIMDETESDSDSNTRRAARVLLAFAPSYDDDTAKQGLTDFLADAMHLCDAAGWTFSTILDRARHHYAAEAHALGKAADPALRRALENE